jgi:hypothetical protein
MYGTHDLSTVQLAAAEALGAGRAAARLLRSPACDPIRQEVDPDPGLARRLSGNEALAQDVTRDVEALLARCDTLIAEGTETRTDWMPKSVCGDDVMEWEPWTRPERTPEAEGLLPVADALRRFLDRRNHLADLLSAEAALADLRKERASE